MKEVKVPEDRVGVIIGEDGSTKEEFEELTDCTLTVENNVVNVEGDVIEEMKAQEIVKAMGRGFRPERAFQLMEQQKALHLIDLDRYADTSNDRERLKGRVIGRDGETRRHIEKETETEISIYGSTIGIIGKGINIEIAQQAIEILLKGSTHSTAYNYLEKNQMKIKR